VELDKLNMYQHLRDFDIPSVVLDEIFRDESDLKILTDAWEDLKSSGLSKDEAAKEIASIIFSLDLFKDPEIVEALESIKDGQDFSKN